jgi:hypothetical protein
MSSPTSAINLNLYNIPRNHPRKNKDILVTISPSNNNPNSNLDTFHTNCSLTPTLPNPKFIVLIMKNQETKTHPILRILKASLSDLPTPSSISYLWNIGFLLGITLTLQIITGLLISIHYTAETSYALSSVIHLIRDVEKG